MNGYIALLISLVTVLILWIFCRGNTTEFKLLLTILSLGIFLYSGLGIASANVDNIYMLYYFSFLIILLSTISSVCKSRIVFTFGKHINKTAERFADKLDASLSRMNSILIIFTMIFFVSLAINIVYPTNRISSLLNFTSITSRGIHARRIEHNSYLLLKLADTAGSATLPFFFVYLYNCAITGKRNKVWGFILCLLWIVLEFGKYNYLSRYEIVIYMGFLLMYIIVCRFKEIKIDIKTITMILIAVIILIPMLVSFTDIRLGRTAVNLGFWDSLKVLLESECHYPEYYEICVQNSGLVNPVHYILWVIFLPIPSAIWSGKPVVQIAYAFTGLFTSTSVLASNYSNLLPSVLGESFLIFGKYFFWVEAVIIGVVIGVYFKFFLSSKKLSLLTAYMLLMLATIGRGGSQSYLSVIINGSVALILYVFLSQRVRVGRARS